MHIKRKTKLIILGIIVVIIGIMVGVIPIFIQKNKEKTENTNINDYIDKTSLKDDENNIDDTDIDEYLLILEIPKLNLKKVVYHFDSPFNTIEKNVEIMKESSLPTDSLGNVVLEAHSGTSNISYFNELYKLNKGDYAYIYYQGIKYIYKVGNKYDVTKDGDVEIYRDINRDTLSLITCKNNTSDRQSVTILYLSSKEEY